MDTGSLNYQWSLSIIHAYVLSGVVNAVISPGSRSTPLTLACARHPDIKTWVQVDERSAAFFALGLAIKSQQPVILICTSGSAVANWLPAVVEANYSQVPLILLSADRPVELQDCGANQTIDQQYLFGSHVRAFHALPEPSEMLLNNMYLPQLIARTSLQMQQPLAGPVHLNIPFREPLLPLAENLNERVDALTRAVSGQHKAVYSRPRQLAASQEDISAIAEVIGRNLGVIVLGRMSYSSTFAETLNQLAEKLDVPVLVDHLSNLRFGKHKKTNYIVNYDLFLRLYKQENLLDTAPVWIIRFGQFPVSKALGEYLRGCADAVSIVVNDDTRRLDPLLTANYFIQSSAEGFCHRLLQRVTANETCHELLSSFREFDGRSAAVINSTLQQQTIFEGHIISMLIEKIVDSSFIFTSNSTMVRALDMFTLLNEFSSKTITLYCNRGASGIDGNLSTYLGLLADNRNATGVALLGDLAFFHDMNGLVFCDDLNAEGYSGTIIIINNNGGHIFNYLPHHELQEFEKYWLTPIKMDLSSAADMYGLRYQDADSVETLNQALENSLGSSGIDIIEVFIDQQNSLASHELLLHDLDD
ncbi:MAG: 2-succinyl-5-enolpyruvyl-6-hydroxy-3-cyclohexene-1-carboxylic-acid synthase [Pseudomonadota bacterium]|nr:2-succinyl-5-enolpyruvyl-6-hydroxy-3-cyclohexene-1-carboxylic-acid synthase [Pseudomonadota bacterium]